MQPDKILEIAKPYDTWDSGLTNKEYYGFTTEALIAFAQSVIEAERDAHGITVPIAVWDKLKDVNTVKDLIKALKSTEGEE
jgi:hypothetical protein